MNGFPIISIFGLPKYLTNSSIDLSPTGVSEQNGFANTILTSSADDSISLCSPGGNLGRVVHFNYNRFCPCFSGDYGQNHIYITLKPHRKNKIAFRKLFGNICSKSSINSGRSHWKFM